MPITIHYIPARSVNLTRGELEPMSSLIGDECRKDGFFRGIKKHTNIELYDDRFDLVFKGISTEDNALINYLNRLGAYYLHSTGLTEVCQVRNVTSEDEGLDKELTLDKLIPISLRENLLNKYELSADEVREEFLCTMTQRLMTDPAYIADKPGIKYEWCVLKHLLLSNPKMLDPFRKVEITLSDVRHDSALQEKIRVYASRMIKEKAEKNHLQLIEVLKVFNIESFDKASIAKGLRAAAHNNRIPELKFLLQQLTDHDVSIKDDGAYKRTALHLATIKGHIECVKLLLAAKADKNLKDGFEKSSADYANASSNVELKKLFLSKDLDALLGIGNLADLANTFNVQMQRFAQTLSRS